MPRLLIVIASVRPVRAGLPVSRWVHERALAQGGFEVQIADLAEIALPFMDEPNLPRLRQYTQQHTLDWSATVDAADAFLFVAPEYNHGYAPSLKNAIDYLFQEWRRKPVGLVSYGGISAGSRGVAALESVLTTVGLVKTLANVEIPFVGSRITDGVFTSDEYQDKTLAAQLEELAALATQLRPLR